MSVVTSLQEKIKKREIQFNLLCPYFKEEKKMEEILKIKISIIFLNDKEITNECFEVLKSKTLTIIKIIDNLQIICIYFMDCYPNIQSNDIKVITEIIFSLQNHNLNYFEINYNKDYDELIKYLNEAEKHLEKRDSIFYKQILNDSRKVYKKDDIKCVKETEKKFNELKVLFEKDGIDKINEKILILCNEPIIEEKDKIFSELKKIMKIFKISKNDNEINNIKNAIILILKREYIFNATSSIIFFIEQIRAEAGNYSGIIRNVMLAFKAKTKISTLRKKLEFLNNINIDPLNGENEYINILMILNGKEEILKFLFNTTIQEYLDLEKIILESNFSNISINELLDMEKCVEFFKNFRKIEYLRLRQDDEVIKLLKEILSKYEYEKISINFTNFINSYSKIKELKLSLDKPTFLKYNIENIINGSTFIISNTKENSFQCIYKKQDKFLKLSEAKENIISIRDRVKLSEEITPLYKYFIESIEEILYISNVLNHIYKKGFSRTIIVKIIFESNNEIEHKRNEDKIHFKKKYIMDDQEKDKIEIYKKLENILLELKDKQIIGYESKSLIRFIYGYQYHLFYNYLIKKNKNDNIIHLLKYITNDLYINDVSEFKIEEKGVKDNIEDYINNIDIYLNDLLYKNNLTLNKIY